MLDKASGRPEPSDAAGLDLSPIPPLRPAWVEVDLGKLRANFKLIQQDKPQDVALCAVVKDEAYGHGAVAVARVAVECQGAMLAVSTLDEALHLREEGIQAPILMLGERTDDELPWCVQHQLQCIVTRPETVLQLERLARAAGQPASVHVKIDTGMSRYGVRWTEAIPLLEQVRRHEWISLEGVLSHFCMSDETDKTFALLQLGRFQEVLDHMRARSIPVRYRHLCNSGGFLDLPQAHFDMVRLGILPLGVYPSQVCRRVPGLQPVMAVKSRVTSIKEIQPGDNVGYGLRYTAPAPRRIGVLPVGYGDGYPRVRNQGHVLVQGLPAPVVGANSMDALMVDLTDIPQAQLWDEAVLMGSQGTREISAHDIARWGGTVSYDVLCGWRWRLPRVYTQAAQ